MFPPSLRASTYSQAVDTAAASCHYRHFAAGANGRSGPHTNSRRQNREKPPALITTPIQPRKKRLKRLLHRCAAAFSPHIIRVGLRREVNHKIHIPWASHEADQQNVAERPSCPQLIHSPLCYPRLRLCAEQHSDRGCAVQEKNDARQRKFLVRRATQKKTGPKARANFRPCA